MHVVKYLGSTFLLFVKKGFGCYFLAEPTFNKHSNYRIHDEQRLRIKWAPHSFVRCCCVATAVVRD